MTRDDVIRMAREAGFSPPVSSDGYMGLAYDDNLQRFYAAAYAAGQASEREARKAAQLETIALREELTKRAMQTEKEAYQRGVRDERYECAKVCDEMEEHYSDYAATALLNGDIDLSNAASGEPRACRAIKDAILSRNNKGNKQ